MIIAVSVFFTIFLLAGCGISLISLIRALFVLFPDVSWGDCSKSVNHLPPGTIGIVIQGDGAVQSSQAGIVQIGVRFLDMGQRCMSPHAFFPLIMIDGNESYENLKHNCVRLSAEIATMNSTFTIRHPISTQDLKVVFHCSSDQKFLCTLFVIPGGKMCILCDVRSDQLASASSAIAASPRYAGADPIFPSSVLPFDEHHVVPDNLHQGMRCADRQMVLWVDSSSASVVSSSSVRAKFTQVIHDIGFQNFEFVKEKNARTFSFRNLSSDATLKVFQSITSDQVRSIFEESKLSDQAIEQIIKINQFLVRSLELLNTWKPTNEQISQLEEATRSFNEEFLKQWGGGDYCNYLHLLSFHAKKSLRFFGNTLCFTCHAMEECNHLDNLLFFNATNHKYRHLNQDDVLTNIMETRLRICLNPVLQSAAPFTCPIDCFPAQTLAGLRRHATASKHTNIEEIVITAQQAAQAEEAE